MMITMKKEKMTKLSIMTVTKQYILLLSNRQASLSLNKLKTTFKVSLQETHTINSVQIAIIIQLPMHVFHMVSLSVETVRMYTKLPLVAEQDQVLKMYSVNTGMTFNQKLFHLVMEETKLSLTLFKNTVSTHSLLIKNTRLTK